MNPTDYIRLIRRGWPILIVAMLLGTAVGYGSTLREDDNDAAVAASYWEARRTIVTDPLAVERADFELSQQALFATSGSVPVEVSAQLDLDSSEMVRRIRSITDVALGSISLVVVAETPEEADAIAEVVGTEFVELIGERERAQFGNERLLAQNEVDRLNQVLTDLDVAIAAEQAKLAAAADDAAEGTTTPTTTAEDDKAGAETDPGTAGPRPVELRDLELQRENASQRYADAVDELNRRNALPDPVSPLSMLSEAASPIEITENAYNQRIRAGEAGQRNFLARDVSLETERVRPLSETTSNGAIRAIMGAVAGLLIGLILLVVRARLDPRVRTAAEAALAYGRPVLAEIPAPDRKNRKSPTEMLELSAKPMGQVSDRFRRIRSELDRASGRFDEVPNDLYHRTSGVIVVVSASPTADTAFVAANLAMSYVELGLAVALFDFDHRRPAVHSYFGKEPTNAEFTRIEENLYIWTSGTETDNPSDIVTQQLRFLSEVRGDADIAIIAATPLLTASETLDIISPDDEILPVFVLGETTLTEVDQVRRIDERNGFGVAGIVVTQGRRDRRSVTRKYFNDERRERVEPPRRLPFPTDSEAPRRFAGFHEPSTGPELSMPTVVDAHTLPDADDTNLDVEETGQSEEAETMAIDTDTDEIDVVESKRSARSS